jgi:hypothetical protein
MIIKIAGQEEGDTLDSLARAVLEQGRANVRLASEFLRV